MAKRFVFLGLTLVLTLVLAEVLLHVAAAISPPIAAIVFRESAVPQHTSDTVLGVRPNPEHPEHDDWGFRNPEVPEAAELVVLGDSQTYGFSIPLEQTWPRVAADALGMGVYNISYPGYGPGQSALLLDQALSLSPRVVVEAFYAGNDLFDVYAMAYERDQLRPFRSLDPEVLDAIAAAERDDPLRPRIAGRNPFEKNWSPLRKFLAEKSGLYGLARAAKMSLGQKRDWDQLTAQAAASDGRLVVFETDNARTLLTPGYRRIALDQTDLRIREGQRIALECLRLLDSRSREAGAAFTVLLIPTKELVFAAFADQGLAAPDEDLRLLVRDEETLWRETRETLDRHGVDYLDLLPALRASVARGDQPYWIDADGHPNAAGLQVIGRAVAEHLEGR